MQSWFRYLSIFIVLAIVVAIPPVINNGYITTIMIFIGLYAMIALGLCLLMGYAGQVSLGQAAFFAIGAYVSGILTATHKQNPWLAMIAAAIVTAIVAGLTGTAILRFQGHVLAVATLALNIIVYVVLAEFDSVTGGLSPGLGGIPRLSIGDFKLTSDTHYYYLIWIILAIAFFLSWNLVHSRMGRALRSMHHFYGGSEEAAESLGIHTRLLKVQIFVLGATFAGIAGSVYAHYVTFINPNPFGILLSLELLVMVILGGLRNLWGAVIGSAIVVALGEVLRVVVPMVVPGAVGEYQVIAYGLLMVIVLIMLPEGLVQAPSKLLGMKRKLRPGASPHPIATPGGE